MKWKIGEKQEDVNKKVRRKLEHYGRKTETFEFNNSFRSSFKLPSYEQVKTFFR